MKKINGHSYTFNSVRIEPEHQIGIHQQHTWELSYIIIGSGTRTIGDVSETFKKGEVILIHPDIPHCWHFDYENTDKNGQISNITVTFGDEFLDNCVSSFPEFRDAVLKIKNKEDAIKFGRKKSKIIAAILNDMILENEAERIVSILRILIIIGQKDENKVVGRFRKKERKQMLLDQIQTYIMCNHCRTITIDDVSRYLGMNRSSFCVFFKREMGCSFISYLNRFRINIACENLKNQGNSIAEICYKSGFNDVPYFNRVFKRLKGMSPREYRNG